MTIIKLETMFCDYSVRSWVKKSHWNLHSANFDIKKYMYAKSTNNSILWWFTILATQLERNFNAVYLQSLSSCATVTLNDQIIAFLNRICEKQAYMYTCTYPCEIAHIKWFSFISFIIGVGRSGSRWFWMDCCIGLVFISS